MIKKGIVKSINRLFSNDIYRIKIEYTNSEWGYLYRYEDVCIKSGDELFYTLRGKRMELTMNPEIANMSLRDRINYFKNKSYE